MRENIVKGQRSFWFVAMALLAGILFIGCGDDTGGGTTCSTDDDCPTGQSCVAGFCITTEAEADVNPDGFSDVITERTDRNDVGPDITPDVVKEDIEPQEDVEQTDLEPDEGDDVPTQDDVEPDDAEQEDVTADDVQEDLPTVTDSTGDGAYEDITTAEVGADGETTDGPTDVIDTDTDGGCTEPGVNITDGPSPVYANMIEMSITDGDTAGVVSTIPVDEHITITELQAMIRIEHIDVEDLTVTLISPAGTRVVLHDQGTNEYGDIMDLYSWYDDEGVRAKPVELLSGFDGEDAYGIWTLEVIDNVLGSQPCDCDLGAGCDNGCYCDPECGYSGRLIQWEVEFGPSTPDQQGGVDYDPIFTWEAFCDANIFWFDSDAMPDVAGAGTPNLQGPWNGDHVLNVLHTFFVIGGDGVRVGSLDSRTFQFTDVF